MKYSAQIQAILREAKETFLDNTSHQFTQLDTKGLNQLVTDIDVSIEKFLVEKFLQLIPGSSIIAEEQTGVQTDAEYQWIIDPIDGTTNFIHQVPVYSISVALQQNGSTIAGFVYEVNRDELFWADETGAFMNNQEIHVSKNKLFSDSLIATGFPYYEFGKVPEYLKVLEFCMKNTRGVRRLGSAAVDLAYVACGRFDAFFEVGLSAWDVAGGAYIVKQAGGKVFDFNNSDNYIFGGEIIAGSNSIVETLAKEISRNFDEK